MCEIAVVARDDCQVVRESDRGDQTVLDRHRASGSPQGCEQIGPAQTSVGFPRQVGETLHAGVEPLFQSCPLFPFRQQQNAKSNFARGERIDGDLALVPPEPLDHVLVESRSRRLAEHVRVDQELHSVSVDLDSMGTKKSFSGQARSQSMTPSFERVGRRTSRYSPRSTRSTSNSWPGSIRSCCRISAGSTICPFDDTVAFIYR